MISSAKPGKSPNSHEPTALWSFQISIKKSGFFAVDKRTAVPQLVGAFKCGNGFHPLGRPYQQFSWDIIFSNPLDVPHQTARFNPKRKHNNWQIREEIEEIIIDFTFFRHRRRFTTPVEQSTIPNRRRHGAQGQLAAALAEVTHLKAEKVGPVMAMWQHQWRFEWRNQL